MQNLCTSLLACGLATLSGARDDGVWVAMTANVHLDWGLHPCQMVVETQVAVVAQVMAGADLLTALQPCGALSPFLPASGSWKRCLIPTRMTSYSPYADGASFLQGSLNAGDAFPFGALPCCPHFPADGPPSWLFPLLVHRTPRLLQPALLLVPRDGRHQHLPYPPELLVPGSQTESAAGCPYLP